MEMTLSSWQPWLAWPGAALGWPGSSGFQVYLQAAGWSWVRAAPCDQGPKGKAGNKRPKLVLIQQRSSKAAHPLEEEEPSHPTARWHPAHCSAAPQVNRIVCLRKGALKQTPRLPCQLCHLPGVCVFGQVTKTDFSASTL